VSVMNSPGTLGRGSSAKTIMREDRSLNGTW